MEYRITTTKTVSITRMKYGWSKHGGARYGLVRQMGDWVCQSCGEDQPAEIPAYMYPFDIEGLREFVRICACCENTYKQNREIIKDIHHLIELCRPNHGLWR